MITVAFSGDLMQFDGPLDLLLALVRRNQYPLENLPVAEITRQYLTYIKDAKQADVELGAEFIETASWLVLLKSRTLLSRSADEEPPEVELERALLDHETLRATADLLRSRIEAAGMGPGMERERGAGTSDMAGGTETDVAVQAAPTVQDALAAARRAVAAAKAHAQGARMIEEEGYPVAAILAQLEQRLRALEPGRAVSTAAWFGELPAPEARVTLLLALLELARLQKVLLAQHERFGLCCLKGSLVSWERFQIWTEPMLHRSWMARLRCIVDGNVRSRQVNLAPGCVRSRHFAIARCTVDLFSSRMATIPGRLPRRQLSAIAQNPLFFELYLPRLITR